MKSGKHTTEYIEIINDQETSVTAVNNDDSTVFKYFIDKKNLDNIILKTLEIDKSFRYVGVEDDLFHVEELRNKSLELIYPTLCHSYATNNTYKTLHKSIILQNLYKRYPIIKGMNMSNILIAGGTICNAIMQPKRKTDLDIFIYGVNEYNANLTMFRILHHLSSFKEGHKFRFVKTINALTINIEKEYGTNHKLYVNEYKIQIIFRLYKTKSEILHSFDLGSSCVGFDGTDILFTTLSKFSYEHECNIVDNTRRSTTYEKRLVKYFDRGFRIVMPKFNINMINMHNNHIVLPRLLIRLCKQYENAIIVNNMHHLNNKYGSDYDSHVFELLNCDIDTILDIKMNIDWIRSPPNKMLSSSYNSIVDDEFTWYGIYLIKSTSWRGGLMNRFKRLFRCF